MKNAYRVVECAGGVMVTVNVPIRHLCPFRDEADEGTASVTYRADTATIELHSLRAWLDTFATARISHEDLTLHIRERLAVIPGITVTGVVTRWNTAGMEIECSTSPTLAATPP